MCTFLGIILENVFLYNLDLHSGCFLFKAIELLSCYTGPRYAKLVALHLHAFSTLLIFLEREEALFALWL